MVIKLWSSQELTAEKRMRVSSHAIAEIAFNSIRLLHSFLLSYP